MSRTRAPLVFSVYDLGEQRASFVADCLFSRARAPLLSVYALSRARTSFVSE